MMDIDSYCFAYYAPSCHCKRYVGVGTGTCSYLDNVNLQLFQHSRHFPPCRFRIGNTLRCWTSKCHISGFTLFSWMLAPILRDSPLPIFERIVWLWEAHKAVRISKPRCLMVISSYPTFIGIFTIAMDNLTLSYYALARFHAPRCRLTPRFGTNRNRARDCVYRRFVNLHIPSHPNKMESS